MQRCQSSRQMLYKSAEGQNTLEVGVKFSAKDQVADAKGDEDAFPLFSDSVSVSFFPQSSSESFRLQMMKSLHSETQNQPRLH